jgi:hypothetical protein
MELVEQFLLQGAQPKKMIRDAAKACRERVPAILRYLKCFAFYKFVSRLSD